MRYVFGSEVQIAPSVFEITDINGCNIGCPGVFVSHQWSFPEHRCTMHARVCFRILFIYSMSHLEPARIRKTTYSRRVCNRLVCQSSSAAVYI